MAPQIIKTMASTTVSAANPIFEAMPERCGGNMCVSPTLPLSLVESSSRKPLSDSRPSVSSGRSSDIVTNGLGVSFARSVSDARAISGGVFVSEAASASGSIPASVFASMSGVASVPVRLPSTRLLASSTMDG